MRKHVRIAIEGGTVRIARWMRELHGASQYSANIFSSARELPIRAR
jgi:hypothetical protein